MDYELFSQILTSAFQVFASLLCSFPKHGVTPVPSENAILTKLGKDLVTNEDFILTIIIIRVPSCIQLNLFGFTLQTWDKNCNSLYTMLSVGHFLFPFVFFQKLAISLYIFLLSPALVYDFWKAISNMYMPPYLL